MPPRDRKAENEDLPDNVYPDKKGAVTYYYFQFPDTLVKEYLGSDKEAAIEAGHELNDKVGRMERVRKPKGVPVSTVVREWLPIRQSEVASDSAKKMARLALERFKADFGKGTLRQLTLQRDPPARQISDWLDAIPLTYRYKARNEVIKLYDYAISRGYLPHDYGNPAKATRYQGSPKAKRMRLGYSDYQAIYAEAPVWLQTLMDVMLHTTLRPGDALRLRFEQFYDGALHTQVKKTRKYLRIKLDQNEHSIIKRARQSGIASPYIVHRMPVRKRWIAAEKDHPTQVALDMASREFSKIRDKLKIGAKVDAKERPSLYEIRSLASWLYAQSGRDRKEVKELMAHTSEQMTALYQDDRRQNFVTVTAGLKLA